MSLVKYIDPSASRASAAPRAAAAPASGRWRSAAVLLLIVAAGVALRGYHIGAECFDCDELYAVRIQGTSPQALGRVVARDAFHTNHPPLMTVPFLYWNALVGTDEGRVRALPFLLSTLTILLTSRLGARLGGPLPGLFAAGLVALNPLHVAYAQEARHYAMLAFLVTAAHLSFVRCLQFGRRLDHAVYLILCLLAALTHYFAVLALTAHVAVCAWLLARGGAAGCRAAVRLLLTLALPAVLCLPWVLVVRFQAGQPWQHLAGAEVGSLTRCLLDVAAVRTEWDAGLCGGVAVVLLIVGTLWYTRRDRLPIAAADGSPPLPRRLGAVAVVVGLCGAAVAYHEAPGRLLPVVRATLASHGYEGSVIEQEVQVLFRLLIAAPAALVAAGLLLLAWPVLLRLASRALESSPARPLPVSILCGALLGTPVLATWAVGFLGIPFLQTRNLIILVPPLAVTLGLGLAALCASRGGRLVAAAAAVLLLCTAAQYRPTAAPLGRDGYPLGMHTYDWRGLDASLGDTQESLPLLTTRTSATDPILYYSGARAPRRLDPATEWPPLPDEFFLAHIDRDAACAAVLARLTESGATCKPRLRDGELVLLAVKMR